jgi:hypothetical protein
MNEIVPDGQTNILAIENLPASVLKAIINKINERTQVTRKIFKSDYNTTADDLKLLLDRVNDEFRGKYVIARRATVTIVMENNARHDFNSWEDFSRFDSAQPERTKSVSIEASISMLDAEQTLQSFKVQVSIQNDVPKIGMFIGPISLLRMDNIGIPPVPMLASIDYNDFIMGKNLLSTVESWERGLPKREPTGLRKLQEHSHKIRNAINLLSRASSIYLCLFLASLLDAATNLNNFVIWVTYSFLFIYLASELGRFVGRRVERNIDAIDAGPNFTFSRGDLNHEKKIRTNNKNFKTHAILYFSASVVQILLSVTANWVWEILKNDRSDTPLNYPSSTPK